MQQLLEGCKNHQVWLRLLEQLLLPLMLWALSTAPQQLKLW
jgi:hypothetical protein